MLIMCPECGRNVADAAVVCIGCGHPITEGTPAPAPAPAQGIRDFPAYAVSKTKLVTLSLVTFGLYEIYWFYRNWKLMRDRHGETVSPFWRAVFSPLTAYSLFERIKGLEGPGREAGWGASGLAVAYLLTISAWRLPDPWWWISVLSFMALIPVQRTINEVAVARGLQVDRSFSGWNFMVLVVGGILLFGSASVTVQDVGMARLPVDSRELAVGGEVWGTLGEEDQVLVLTRVQAWGLELREGQQVTVDMTSDDFDAFLDLTGQGLVLYDDDSGGGCQARITFTAPQDGLYRVVASPGMFSKRTGQFILRVGAKPGPLAEGFCFGV